VAGVRYENTRNEYDAFRRNSATGVVDRVSDSSSYDHFFPGILATYRLTKDVALRASWTNTIARPDYDDISPSVNAQVNLNANPTEVSLEVGNPDLQPFESMNWDASIEWYYQAAGSVSLGVFYKDIKNFEFDRTEIIENSPVPPEETGPIPGATSTYRIEREQPVNGPKAKLYGIEFSLSHKFTGLPKPLDGFGIIANATLVEGESILPPLSGRDRSKIDQLPQQVDKTFNAQLYWENHVFAARVAWNYNGGYLESVGLNATLPDEIFDGYVDESETIDLSFEWKATRWGRFYVEVKNLTEEYTERKYQGFRNRPTLREETGRTFLTGVKVEF
jgi:TonB-dependent receptor